MACRCRTGCACLITEGAGIDITGTGTSGDPYVVAATALSSQITYVRKSADESVVSSTTLQNDDHLVIAVSANATFFVHLTLIWTPGAGAFKHSWTGPSGATMVWADSGSGGMSTLTTVDVWTQTSGTLGAQVTGLLVTSGTAGNLTFQWAQNASNAAATTVKAGSGLVLTKLT